jgi:integrase
MAKERSGNGYPSIFQNPNGKGYYAKPTIGYKDGKQLRRTITGRTKRDVAEKLQPILEDLRKGLPVPSSTKLTVGQFLDLWQAGLKVRPSTLVQYRNSVKYHIKPYFEKYKLIDLSEGHLRSWHRLEIDKGVSISTIRTAHATLRIALSQAVKDRVVQRNVAKVEPSPRAKKYQAKFLTAEQVKDFLSFLRDYNDQYGRKVIHRMYAFYSLAFYLGLRKGELCSLSFSDLDMVRGTISIKTSLQRVGDVVIRDAPKTDESIRTIMLPANLLAALKEHRIRILEEKLQAGPKWIGCEWNPLFPSDIGTHTEPRTVNRQFSMLLKQAGLPNIRVHDMRHTAASLMLGQGIPVNIVSKILGHSNPSITYNIYSHIMSDQQEDAMEKMNRLISATA